MASKKATAKQVVAPIEEAPMMDVAASEPEAAADATEAPTEGAIFVLEDRVQELNAAKRERGYSQSAINKEDLERLNGLKALVKDKMKLNISNQRILSAALDCLGMNVEAFLKTLADEVNEKNKAKDMKTLEELKKKLNIE
jgi:hypothetical protein